MANANICFVHVSAELIAVVENLVTLKEEALFMLTYSDQFGRFIKDGTCLVEFTSDK